MNLPLNPADSLPKAAWWLRLASYVIDALAAAVVGLIAFLISDNSTVGWYAFEIFFFLHFCIGWLQGQTLGMLLLKIKVITTEGKPLGWLRVLWRYIAFTLSLFSVIGMVWIIFDRQKQGLHDKLAKTYVIKLVVRESVL